MPRHVRKHSTAGSWQSALKSELVAELRTEREFGQPIILEDHTPETNSIRVHVIWDRWKECPAEQRSAIIEDAYEEVEGEETRNQLTLTLGVTMAEAVAIGLLPFSVMPARKRTEHPSFEQYEKVMRQLMGSDISGRGSIELRFATEEDAEAAMAELEKRLPGSKWIIARQVTGEYVMPLAWDSEAPSET